MEALHTGGMTWTSPRFKPGKLNVSWPFASIRITPQRLIFSIKVWKPIRAVFGLIEPTLKINQEFVLEKDLVVAVHPRRGISSTGLVFEHHSSGCPDYIQFWTLRKKAVIAELRDRGYKVGER
jgi:hypothetical protein